MQINPIQDKTSFKTKYNFIDFQEFSELRRSKDTIKISSTYDNFSRIKRGKKAYIVGIDSCTAYGLLYLKDAILGHYNRFASEIRSFVENSQIPKAFAIGGNVNDLDKYFKKDIESFRESKTPTTIFWGQQDGGLTNLLYDSGLNVCYVNKVTNINTDDPISVTSIDDLKKAYKIINITSGDEVRIKNKRFDSAVINQNNENYLL